MTLARRPAVVGFVLVQQDGRWKVGADYLAEVTIQTSIGDSVRVGGALVPAGLSRVAAARRLPCDGRTRGARDRRVDRAS